MQIQQGNIKMETVSRGVMLTIIEKFENEQTTYSWLVKYNELHDLDMAIHKMYMHLWNSKKTN